MIFYFLKQQLQEGIAKKIENTKIKKIPFAEVKVNDLLIISQGDIIPTDGIVISGDGESFILQLKNISNADLSSDTAKLLVSQVNNQLNNSLSADLFESFANMARMNSKLDLNEQALNAIHSSFQ